MRAQHHRAIQRGGGRPDRRRAYSRHPAPRLRRSAGGPAGAHRAPRWAPTDHPVPRGILTTADRQGGDGASLDLSRTRSRATISRRAPDPDDQRPRDGGTERRARVCARRIPSLLIQSTGYGRDLKFSGILARGSQALALDAQRAEWLADREPLLAGMPQVLPGAHDAGSATLSRRHPRPGSASRRYSGARFHVRRHSAHGSCAQRPVTRSHRSLADRGRYYSARAARGGIAARRSHATRSGKAPYPANGAPNAWYMTSKRRP